MDEFYCDLVWTPNVGVLHQSGVTWICTANSLRSGAAHTSLCHCGHVITRTPIYIYKSLWDGTEFRNGFRKHYASINLLVSILHDQSVLGQIGVHKVRWLWQKTKVKLFDAVRYATIVWSAILTSFLQTSCRIGLP